MAFDLDDEELEATRRQKGLIREKSIEEDLKEIRESIEEAYRSYDYDLDYSPFSKEIAEILERILSERESDKKRIKELEEENNSEEIKAITQVMNKSFEEFMKDYIPKQKVKDLITEIQEAFNKLDKETDKQIEDKDKDYYKWKENIAIMQTLAYCRDKIEELLEGK